MTRRPVATSYTPTRPPSHHTAMTWPVRSKSIQQDAEYEVRRGKGFADSFNGSHSIDCRSVP